MITVLITVGALPPARRDPVLKALALNLANPSVSAICIVTEASSAEMEWLYEAVGENKSRVDFNHVATRPNFGDLFEVGNRLLAAGADTVALMNADISIATEDDGMRMRDALSSLDGRNSPVLLALSRHESGDGRTWLGLYEPNGLPNTISADAWVYQRALKIERELFYMPGQMNCDMMLACDLKATGHRLFNPCLNIKIIHHEPEKSEAYYEEKNSSTDVQESLWRHVKQNNIDPWNYYGTPWLSSEWLKLGYKPAANSTHGRRLIVALPEKAEKDFGSVIPRLADLISRFNLEIQIVAEGNLDRLVKTHAAALSKLPEIWISKSRLGLAATQRAFWEGKQYCADRVAFVTDLGRIDEALMSAVECVFLTVSNLPSKALVAYGCTLVTSIFRSDDFIRGFVSNTTALAGYGRLIEHVLLVSSLSKTEIDTLTSFVDNNPNIVAIWHRNDPGLYECWNIGIRVARTEYVSNANVDDLRHPQHVATLIRRLEARPSTAVAATALIPFYEYPVDGTLPAVKEVWYADKAGFFEFKDLAHLEDADTLRLSPNNIPHCMPVWRKALHDQFGWFDETQFGTYADWAFWLKVLESGNTGWLDSEPLSYYYVNPTSHNRRGTNLEALHRTVELTFAPSFVARRAKQPQTSCRILSKTTRKLHLLGLQHSYGQHRTSFNTLISALEPLNKGSGGIRFIPFLERQFVWGDCAEDGEAGSTNPKPITEPWIGILHVPFDTPDWFEFSVNPKNFFSTSLFQESLPFCRGLITLSDDLQRDLYTHLPGIPTLSVRFPTTLDVRMWEADSYARFPCVVQVGDWLRKLQAIHRLKTPGHRRVMLLKKHTAEFMRREITVLGDFRDPAVEMLELVPNEEYDLFLARSVVLCLMYSTAANNIIIECIARATPIIVNPLPGAIEYLGRDYPLYVLDENEAKLKLETPGLVQKAHDYLLRRRVEIDLSYERFCSEISNSAFYKNL